MTPSGGGHRGALTGLVVAVAAAGAAYGGVLLPGPTPGWSPWLLALGGMASILSLMALGAARDRRLGPLLPVFVVAALVVGGGFAALLLLPPAESGDSLLVLGLPLRAAILLYGVGLVPTVLIPVAYALTFEQTLTDEDLDRVRRARAERVARGDGARGAEREAPE